jgi:hypothetical protein
MISVNASALAAKARNGQLFITVIAWSSSRRQRRPKPFGGISYPPIGVQASVPPPPGP